MCKNPAMAATMPSSPSEPHRVVVLAVAPVIGGASSPMSSVTRPLAVRTTSAALPSKSVGSM